ncbi:MAG: phosphoglucosamine mutase [Flavobacteriaceae bacterium]|nr:phosphoglucosamine mutase [Flavobacteriaceae bacterium]MCY4267544.1 phosphoglucosamine mutase [Flavobacteriaceae bacterium]
MPLIKSVSGFRGTIGGVPGENLTPLDIIKFTSAYAMLLLEKHSKPSVMVGRDGRISGTMVQGLVIHNLLAMGIDVIDLGLSTTPTVEYNVLKSNASGGIILTASHNQRHWNALKMLNEQGQIISKSFGQRILKIAATGKFKFASVDELGQLTEFKEAMDHHIQGILSLDIVNSIAIKKRKFQVVIDTINSTGSLAFPLLMEALDIQYEIINQKVDGKFKRDPEPLAKNLSQLSQKVIATKADLGIAVDPDVDRLVLIDEKGIPFGEEYTIVACTDYVLSHKKGATVSNLSTTRAVRDITKQYGGEHFTSSVGEFFVVEKMKQVNAVIGGEGSGGVIYPKLHYGRDALNGVALFLSLLAQRKKTVSALKQQYPQYYMCKDKLRMDSKQHIKKALSKIKELYQKWNPDLTDGVKIDFDQSWVHIRESNTESIVRIYAEAHSQKKADALVHQIQKQIKESFDFLRV